MRFSTATLGVLLIASSSGLALATSGTPAPGSTTTVQATPMTDAQIQQKLQSEGYTNVQVTKHDKGHIDVTAMKNGKAEKLAVNPQTGALTSDSDDD